MEAVGLASLDEIVIGLGQVTFAGGVADDDGSFRRGHLHTCFANATAEGEQ